MSEATSSTSLPHDVPETPEQPPQKLSEAPRCDINGVTHIWNATAYAWLPEVNVNEDFIAQYQANYGVHYDYDKMEAPKSVAPVVEPKEKLTKEEKRAKKRELAEAEAARANSWVDFDQSKSTQVYVSGLPSTVTEEELMAKYGVINEDPRTSAPKVRLYKNDDGTNKGDGTCAYVRPESVELALNLLDGSRYDTDHVVHVERAKYEKKGEFDPSKKKARLTAAQKKRFQERQQQKFEWTPDKPRGFRPVSDCTVVLKHMFTLEEIDKNAALIMDIKTQMKDMYSKFGNLKRVEVYDTNPEGVVTLTYDNVEASDLAVKSLDNIIRNGRQISASLWDGKTRYRLKETEEEARRRDEAWKQFLEDDEEQEEEIVSKET